MENNQSVIVRRAGNGFEVFPSQMPDLEDGQIRVFSTKKEMLRFVDRHFSEKRAAKEKAEKGEVK